MIVADHSFPFLQNACNFTEYCSLDHAGCESVVPVPAIFYFDSPRDDADKCESGDSEVNCCVPVLLRYR